MSLLKVISAVIVPAVLVYASAASAQRATEASASGHEMLEAIETLDHSRAEKLLQRGFSPNTPFSGSGASATHVAARIGDAKMLALFIEYGAIVDLPTQDTRRDSPLLIAAGAGNLGGARYLLAHGANPNYQNGVKNDDYAVSHYAATSQNGLKMLKLLSRYKTNFNVASLAKTSVLNSAIFSDRADAADFLLTNGVDGEAKDIAGLRPICHAVLKRDIDVIRIMIKHRVSLSHLDCSDGVSGGLSPLHVASGSGSVEIVRVLTKAGASWELRSTQGMLPEDIAKAQGHTETVSYLRGLMMGRRNP
ncbi:ankyrin repeat protein [Variovorax paradoxus]|uniref:ankyrin repeat domain-containing protein n=1 Tax=Variovorax paradoxus TaxID=34073 RepID=UPI0027855D25|nr:ankyrin repeat domain-containing protein [Variovorax paradoxus]MDQ0028131.1 ankyrin repeat protein [Variovorax paradoxus]